MNQLSDEILILIFEFLDSRNLINLKAVSERFNRLISCTAILVRKPTMILDMSVWDEPRERDPYDPPEPYFVLGKVNYKLQEFSYRNFKLNSNYHRNCITDELISLFRKYNIKMEKLSASCFAPSLMVSMLTFAAPTLTHLVVSSYYPDVKYESLIELPKLEYLRLKSIDSILWTVKCKNLVTLDIESCRDEKAFINFLKLNQNLPKLKNFKTFKVFWKVSNIIELPFQLEDLEVTHFTNIDLQIIQNFLFPQAESLRTLRISEHLIPTSTVNFVLENLKNLKSLYIFGAIFDDQKLDIMCQSRNSSVTLINMHLITPLVRANREPELNAADYIIKTLFKCKNLQSFKFQGDVSTDTQSIASLELKRLKNLQLKDLRQLNFWNCFEFPMIENFRVETVTNVEQLLILMGKMKNMRHLQVDVWRVFNYEPTILTEKEAQDFLALILNLQVLRIKSCIAFPRKFFAQLEQFKPKKMQLFEVNFNTDEYFLQFLRKELKESEIHTIINDDRGYSEVKTGKWEVDVDSYQEDDLIAWANREIDLKFKALMETKLVPFSYPHFSNIL